MDPKEMKFYESYPSGPKMMLQAWIEAGKMPVIHYGHLVWGLPIE